VRVSKLQEKRSSDKLPLNDRVLKMVLIRYSMYQNIPPKEVELLDEHVHDTILKMKRKKS